MNETSESPPRPAAPRRHLPALALLAVATMALYYFASSKSAPPQEWTADWSTALREARTTGRYVMIDFYMNGCPPCEIMHRSVLRSSAVQAALGGFVPLRIDVAHERELANRFEVFGTPTYIIVDAQGQFVTRTEGLQTEDAFVAFLRQVAQPTPAGADSSG